jgi:hypothetical protein
MTDARDRDQTRRYLIKSARSQLKGCPMRTNSIEELVDGVMQGRSFVDAVTALVDDSYLWEQY